MSTGIDKLASELQKVIEEKDSKKKSPYESEAKVLRVEDDTVWVKIPGGTDETPAQRTINAKPGDSVKVRVSNNSTYILGNTTSPPTDDTTAYIAIDDARDANQNATAAGIAAEQAINSATIANEKATEAISDAADAHQAAQEAKDDAADAKEAATQAQADASDAKEAASSASQSAESAASSASAASTSASQAATRASNAEASAQAAESSAKSAQTSASTAGENASRAQAASEAAQAAALSSITSDILHYLATNRSEGVKKTDAGWTTTVQTIDSTNRYLWTYHTYTTANGTSTDTNPVISGVYGDPGQSGGKGDKGDPGETGPQGDDGVSVTSVQPQYYLSTSDSVATGGSWSNSLQYVPGKYIWTRDMVSYDDGTSKPSTEIYNQALTQSCKDAAEALGLVQEQKEYFWHDSQGAHVLSSTDASGTRYRLDMVGSGTTITQLNSNGTESVIATFGENINFSSDHAQYIGNQNAYVIFDPTGNGGQGSLTIGGSSIQMGNRTLDDVLGNTLIYDHTYEYVRDSNNKPISANFTAFLYRGGVDVKTEYEPSNFTWYLKKEEKGTGAISETLIATGYTCSVNLSDCGYGAEIVGKFTIADDAYALNTNGDNLTDASNTPMSVRSTGESVRVRDLSTSSTIFPTDKLMIVGGEDEHLVSIQTLQDYLNANLDKQVIFDTTAGWSAQTSLVSKKDTLYVYTDHQTDAQGNKVAGIKAGDGLAYVVDLPFTDAILTEHIADNVRHITQTERDFWNNKVRCYYAGTEQLIFTTT